MSNFFEIFDPGLRRAREQLEVEKMLIVTSAEGGRGPIPLDLDSGKVVLRLPQSYAAAMIQPPNDEKDWTWVLAEPCPECAFDATAVELAELPHRIRSATDPWSGILATAEAPNRPSPAVWSPLEYACHVRDVLTIFTERNRLIRTQEAPRFPNWDQDATALAERYWEQAPAQVAIELAAAARISIAAWSDLTELEWQRPGYRSNGSEFTLASLGRYFLHDLEHHLHDVSN